jgi:hypothetical protein
MTNKASNQKLIVSLVRRYAELAKRDYVDAAATHAATMCGARVWNQFNTDDGVGCASRNPYNIESAKNQLTKTSDALMVAESALAYAIDTFLESNDV